MPYASNKDLPPSVRGHLPEHAQDIYRAAFNHGFASHAADVDQVKDQGLRSGVS